MRRTLTALFLMATLTGCATRWVVDNNVSSHSALAAVAAGASYRFERLPSQQDDAAAQRALEAMAEAALARVGLRRDDVAPAYTAQIGVRVTSELSPWADPWLYGGGWGPRRGYPGGWGWQGAMFPPAATPWYAREVNIVLRELPSHRIVYETRARNEGPYASSTAVLPVMFDAALQGFPNPPAGERRVDIELPRAASR
ncbi:MAG: hypothetical protein JWQ03_1990 [Variovorax sp.]|nr:hypothetical protein [Variovorax sp.]